MFGIKKKVNVKNLSDRELQEQINSYLAKIADDTNFIVTVVTIFTFLGIASIVVIALSQAS